ncbi:NAD(P)/FAD-dependent oxidoreductase [Sulfitobacter geojensis]|uniref:FAD-binding oxidoreductase n=1 Tax=Sulfitobacter geojensis TaxID=1342299 RepID=A0AAE2W264_9RHOB|nr:FAD-binding oxidoreductase [Sulfitobacter geojensis]MBM1690732.1 FAD-binding oxidoreductase [Sulfitobacter geojensis]MBM1694798.1 FAD-binding oxidoreductase [Sulfitobacter geojensis]MBM1707048.1 FAD-binding oxidoreductase [Sulfitobacter geojensis]MBM1711106.1 FAD-binding oxidoreductase [Sulfitobacter geojensis]MBM1715172.1 FAD-binding oxidoreductase [Sulfitobacter geojensis]
MAGQTQSPQKTQYDVVIVGGAIMGASAAWFLSDNADFDGTVLVIDRDLTYEACSTTHTNSCMRQQFSTELNVRISQFAADFVTNMPRYMGNDDRVPNLRIRNFGYMYLADTEAFAGVLKESQAVQVAAGAATKLMTADEIKAAYPFYNVDDIVLGSINTVGEGFWDATAVFDWWRKSARERGVEYVENEVVAITRNAAGTRVESVTLKSGEVINCGHIINASGPRAVATSRMAGIEVPVEPRKRYSWIFSAEQPLDVDLPLTIDPSGVHVRENGGGTYQCGGHSDVDPAVDYDDYTMDFSIWENYVWPILATRIPQFEAIKVQSEWAGHYAMNTFDHNAIMGPHTEVENFIFLNGFSGHGLQQAPAMGRGTAEWITYGGYRELDLKAFNFERIPNNRPIVEKAII